MVILTKLGLHLGVGGPNTRDHEPLQHQLYSITEEESWTWPQSRGCLRRPLSGSRRVEIAKGEDSVLVNSTHLLGEPSRSVKQLLATLTTPPSTNRQTTTTIVEPQLQSSLDAKVGDPRTSNSIHNYFKSPSTTFLTSCSDFHPPSSSSRRLKFEFDEPPPPAI